MAKRVVKHLGLSILLTSGYVSADTLLDSVNEALATNPEIMVRTSAAQAVGHEVKQARAGFYPKVDLSGNVGYERTRNGTTIGAYQTAINPSNPDRDLSVEKHADRTRRQASLTATQMLWDGQFTSYDLERQEARSKAANLEICSIVESISLNAIEAYIGVIRNRALVESAEDNLAQHEEIVKLIRRKADIGLSSDADQAQAEGRLVLAKANHITSQAALRDAETLYRRVVGNLPDVFEAPGSISQLPTDLEAALKVAGSSHPILQIARTDVEAAQAQYEGSKSTFSPTVELALAANWGKDVNGDKGTVYDHSALLRFNFNLYNGGADSARKAQTSQLMNEAIEVKNRVHRQIEEEVRLAWVAVSFGQERLNPLESHVSLSKESRDYYKKQFQVGTRTLLDMLDSQREFFNASNALIRGSNDLMFSEYRLLQSTGSLATGLSATLPEAASQCRS
ncbi:MAG: TolC family outer membrane protein [Endozoicomonas sp.]|uniref:TolC family outer membrane protein n=1 Tax=Endozoicomonas sp. TaxID=1892382 RepID=UPI003D9B5131